MPQLASQPAPKLPLWQTVWEAHALTFRNGQTLIQIAWLWAAAMLLLVAVLNYFVFGSYYIAHKNHFSLSDSVLNEVPEMIELLAVAAIAVGWHRFVLLDERAGHSRGIGSTERTRRYFFWAFVIVYLAAIPVLIAAILLIGPDRYADLSAAPDDVASPVTALDMALAAATLAGVAAVSYVPVRLSLILPARALGHDTITASEVWTRTRGQFWRLFIGFIACGVIMTLMLVALVPSNENNALEYARNHALSFVLALLGGMIGVTFLSLAYRHLFADQLSVPPNAG